MNRTSRLLSAPPSALLFALVALFIAPRASAAPQVPANFVVENIAPGATLTVPTCIATLPDGRVLVGEKRGRVYAIKNGVKNPTPLWQRDAEVLDSDDRGLLSIAVDPNYTSNRFVYFLYTVDPDSNNNENNVECFGRLTRYQVSLADSNIVDPSTRTILMGSQWSNGPLEASGSHTVGCLAWGTDGSLLVSAGDGSDFTVGPDGGGLQPNAFLPGRTDPAEDIGAFRSQYIRSLCGKVLRINPSNGHGYPSNPFWDGNASSVKSRVWSYGFRNPYRFTVRPGSGSADPANGNPGAIYLGDVGWNDWEEWDVITGPGFNAGWPCIEGPVVQEDYDSLTPSHLGCDSIGVSPDDPSPASAPAAYWHHRLDYAGDPPGFLGNASTGGIFYSDTLYPAQYRGRYFHGDYGQSWVRVATMSPSNQMQSFDAFGSGMEGPVCFAREPGTGNILYVSIFTGQVRRIRYTGPVGGDAPPIAVATGTPTVGPAPLIVQFDGAGSSDPDNDPLTYSWTFGDGDGSTQRDPSHTYSQAGSFLAILTADDGRGGIGRDTVVVLVSPLTSFPSTGVLDDFNRADAPLTTPWTADVGGLAVLSNALVQNSGYGFPIWNGAVFGPDQEAFITLKTITGNAAPERDLVLKAQGTVSTTSHIEIRYDAALNQVDVGTYDPGNGWLVQGAPIPVTFVAGDRFGARAYANGQVEVYRNTTRIGVRTLAGWPFVTDGGRIGLTIDAVNEGSFDDFGGGNVVFAVNHPPVATITSPLDHTFYAAPDSVQMQASATDPDEPADSLDYHWDVFLHHNTHIHYNLSLDGAAGAFVSEDHDDGSGVYYEIRMIVTDSGGLTDTASVAIYPEADLEPSPIETNAGHLGPSQPSDMVFYLRNHGRMLAHLSSWKLLLDGAAIAAGDTIVAPLDSVTIHVTVPGGTLTEGNHTLRAVADSNDVVVETNEANNACVQTLNVPASTTGVGADGPVSLALSMARPNPTRDAVSFALDLPRETSVSFDVLDLQGRAVSHEAPRAMPAGRWMLRWDGRTAEGAPAPAGLYLARVRAEGVDFVRRIALIR